MEKLAGTGEANTDGSIKSGFEVEKPSVVDPAALAPLVKDVRLSMAPSSAFFTVRDAEDGVRTLEVTNTVNARATIAHFEPGSRRPIEVAVARTDDHLPASFTLKSCNMFGECTVKAATLLGMTVEETLATHTLTNLPPTQSRAFFLNGDPGGRMLSFLVNDRRFSLRPLSPGQTLEADLSLAMTSGKNAMKMALRGTAGSEGLFLLMDQ
jgi:hypothetical protein